MIRGWALDSYIVDENFCDRWYLLPSTCVIER